MHELSRFLGEHHDTILDTAAGLAAARPPGTSTDRLSERLAELAAALDAGDAAPSIFEAAIATHAAKHWVDGAEVRTVIGEFQVLRRAMFDVYTRDSEPRLAEVLALDELVDRAIAAWIDFFTAHRDRVTTTLAMMSEGLRVPLAAISATTQMLARARPVDVDVIGKVSDDVLTNAQQMTEVIDGMLDYARLTASRDDKP